MGGPRNLKLADGLTIPDSKNWNATTFYKGIRAWAVILKGPLKRNRMGRDGTDWIHVAQHRDKRPGLVIIFRIP
jgi:hypothetical protein